ncbi:MAG: ATP-grasp domain-containing protein [Bacteroidales bacterium]|jgi:hypothetical protein|nr:ATP-grasp domain-containing protein [Bacteroidales bacterium]
MRIIFCDNVLNCNKVDTDYKEEMNAALSAGLNCSLISFEELNNNNAAKAVSNVEKSETEVTAVYRGWMLTPERYKILYNELLKKNLRLINNPDEYKHCHYLPESYATIEAKTPKTVWTIDLDNNSLINTAKTFGNNPVIVKDFVKSEKHYWHQACFIPDASDTDNLISVTKKFIQLRGDDLNCGILFRSFEKLKFLTNHSESGMPLTKEFRIFFTRNKVIDIYYYWDQGEYGDITPDIKEFIDIAKNINSNFFSMDVAQKSNGEWIIMELGDSQVTGLPENADINTFYTNLYNLN